MLDVDSMCLAPLHHPSTRALLGLPSPSPPRFQQPARPALMLSSSSPRATSTDPSDSQASSKCERPREGGGEPIFEGDFCVFQDAKGIPAQTLRHLESILRAQREQKARRFSEFLSLREKLIKEATSRVKDRQKDRALVSQPEGEVPGELACLGLGAGRVQACLHLQRRDIISVLIEALLVAQKGQTIGLLQMAESKRPLLEKQGLGVGWSPGSLREAEENQGHCPCSDIRPPQQLSSVLFCLFGPQAELGSN